MQPRILLLSGARHEEEQVEGNFGRGGEDVKKKEGECGCWRWWKKRERDRILPQVGGYDGGGGKSETSGNVSDKSGLFYSRQVHETEKRIDRSIRAKRKLLHIYLSVFTSASCLPTLSVRQLDRLSCPSWLPACLLSLRNPLVDYLSALYKVSVEELT